MTPDTLYELIHTLGKQEKRYFKLYASRNREANYKRHIKMFSAYESVKSFDKLKIRQKLKAFDVNRHIAETKYQLQNLILKSLVAYYGKLSSDAFLREKISAIEVMISKSLFNQAMKVIKKTKTVAGENENYPLLLELLKMERNILFKTANKEELDKHLNFLIEEKHNTLENLSVIHHYLDLCDKLYLIHNSKGVVRTEEEKKSLNGIMADPLLQNIHPDSTLRSKYYFHHAWSLYGFMLQDHAVLFKHCKANVDLMVQNENLITENITRYISVLSGYAVATLALKEYGLYENTMEIMKKLPAKYPSLIDLRTKVLLFELSYFQELNYYLNRGDFDKGMKLSKEIEKILPQYKGKIFKSSENILHYNIAVIHFWSSDYKGCIKWLNYILNDTGSQTREDVQSMTRILQIICHYELGNAMLLPYLIRSTYRYLWKRKTLHKVENILLKYLRKLSNVSSSADAIKHFKKLKEELLPFRDDEQERSFFSNFDFIAWLDSKIQKKPLAELIRP